MALMPFNVGDQVHVVLDQQNVQQAPEALVHNGERADVVGVLDNENWKRRGYRVRFADGTIIEVHEHEVVSAGAVEKVAPLVSELALLDAADELEKLLMDAAPHSDTGGSIPLVNIAAAQRLTAQMEAMRTVSANMRPETDGPMFERPQMDDGMETEGDGGLDIGALLVVILLLNIAIMIVTVVK